MTVVLVHLVELVVLVLMVMVVSVVEFKMVLLHPAPPLNRLVVVEIAVCS